MYLYLLQMANKLETWILGHPGDKQAQASTPKWGRGVGAPEQGMDLILKPGITRD